MSSIKQQKKKLGEMREAYKDLLVGDICSLSLHDIYHWDDDVRGVIESVQFNIVENPYSDWRVHLDVTFHEGIISVFKRFGLRRSLYSKTDFERSFGRYNNNYHTVVNLTHSYQRVWAAVRIQSAWRRTVENPTYLRCRRRLEKEFKGLSA